MKLRTRERRRWNNFTTFSNNFYAPIRGIYSSASKATGDSPTLRKIQELYESAINDLI